MKSIREAISRIMEVDQVTDMEAVLFILRQMDTSARFTGDEPYTLPMPVLTIAHTLMDELSNPFARSLLADRLKTCAPDSSSSHRPDGIPLSKEKP